VGRAQAVAGPAGRAGRLRRRRVRRPGGWRPRRGRRRPGGAGAINVLYGSPGGLTGAGSQLFTQGNPEPVDSFGASLATGDFDNNGFFDLAVGAPIERVGSQQAAGAVSVFYAFGGPGGVVMPGPAFLQGSGGVGGTAEAFDFFGAALE
jgi:hypothetical protein